MAKAKCVIEVRVNEYMKRDRNPNVPFTPEEIGEDVAECVRQGASIVHYHARDPQTGGPSADPKIYAEIERQIRGRCDVVTMPTLGAYFVTSGRADHILEMARDPLTRPDCVPIDVITTNMAMFDWQAGDFNNEAVVYENTIETLKSLCTSVKSAGVKPVAMIWNIASIRVAQKLKALGYFDSPLFAELVLFGEFALGFGHPSTIKGLYSLLDFLPQGEDWRWIAHGHDNTLPIAAAAIEAGGHVTIGLGDYPYPELGQPTNGQLVGHVAAMARAMGRDVSSVAETRATLGMPR